MQIIYCGRGFEIKMHRTACRIISCNIANNTAARVIDNSIKHYVSRIHCTIGHLQGDSTLL